MAVVILDGNTNAGSTADEYFDRGGRALLKQAGCRVFGTESTEAIADAAAVRLLILGILSR